MPRSTQQSPTPLAAEPDHPVQDMIIILKIMIWRASFPVFLALSLASLAILTGTMPWVIEWLITPGNGGGVYLAITPEPIGLWVDGATIGIWFFIVFTIVFSSVMWGVYRLLADFEGKPIFKRFSIPEYGDSGIEVTAKLFMMTGFVYLIYVFILAVSGTEPNTPDFGASPIRSNIYSFVNAAVNEEIISRMFLIGTPLLFIETVAGARRRLRRYFLGGDLPVNLLTASLIVFSATMFSFAHVGGWDIYKVPTAFIAGLALGYLFVRFGLWAAILLHFVTNFMFIGIDLWPDSVALSSVLAICWLIMAAVGLYFFIHYFRKSLEFLAGAFGSMPESRDEKTVRPPPEIPRDYFVCRNCGEHHARYDSERGTLVCLKCGYPHR